jgi:hypothetical protein
VAPFLTPFRQRNAVMFHLGRSGSRVIAEMLRQQPGCFWDGEIYEKRFGRLEREASQIDRDLYRFDPVAHLRRRMRRAGWSNYGFEVKFFHLELTEVSLTDYVAALGDLGFRDYIVLERRNTLRKVVSSVIAHQRAQFHRARDASAELTRIVLDVDDIRIDRTAKPLLAFLEDFRAKLDELTALLEGKNVLWMTYEEDVSVDPRQAYARVCEFLGMQPQPATVPYGKTNPFALDEMISNFDEVERTLRGTPFEWMLYD